MLITIGLLITYMVLGPQDSWAHGRRPTRPPPRAGPAHASPGRPRPGHARVAVCQFDRVATSLVTWTRAPSATASERPCCARALALHAWLWPRNSLPQGRGRNTAATVRPRPCRQLGRDATCDASLLPPPTSIVSIVVAFIVTMPATYGRAVRL
jgi:hypothetical protein